MRHLIRVAFGLALLTVPAVASAQTNVPPPVVQTLKTPEVEASGAPWLGAIAGTTVAIVGMNAWTGGALLAPSVGPAISGVLGGSWFGTLALGPASTHWMFENTSLIAYGVSGGLVGYWLGNR